MSDQDKVREEARFFADRPAVPPTLLELISAYGAKMAAAERVIQHRGSEEREAAVKAEAAAIFGEIGRRYRAAQALTTYTDRATVMETLDGVA